MNDLGRRCRMSAGIFGFHSVGAGAFMAHGMDWTVAGRSLTAFETGVRYEMYHALALLVLGLRIGDGPATTAQRVAGEGFMVGTILFSGSLFLLGLAGPRWLGMITPLGGLALMVGWAAVAASAGSRRGGADRL